MKKVDVHEDRVMHNGKLSLKLTYYINNKFDHIEYVTDNMLI